MATDSQQCVAQVEIGPGDRIQVVGIARGVAEVTGPLVGIQEIPENINVDVNNRYARQPTTSLGFT